MFSRPAYARKSVDRCDEQINHPESCIPIFVASRVEVNVVVHNDFEFSSEGERRESQSILDLGIVSLVVNNEPLSQDSGFLFLLGQPGGSPSLPALSRPSPLLAT
jgi:hypothetical protein